jgi:phospholipid/cholesterol/gamma-HCH transport system substrate-binding protein
LKRVSARLDTSNGIFAKLVDDSPYSAEVAENIRVTMANLAAITKKINEGKGTLGALVNERTLYDGAEDVFAGVNDSKFGRWMLRHYQKKGIELEESGTPKPPPAP